MLYFLRYENYVKIGHSDAPNKRISQIQTSIPFKMEVLCITNGGFYDEKRLHGQFKEYRSNGEWFELSDAILDYIKSCKDLKWQYGYGGLQEDLIELNPLKSLRIRLGFTLEEVASTMGITKQAYLDCEKRCLGGRITINSLRKCAKSLGAKLELRLIVNED